MKLRPHETQNFSLEQSTTTLHVLHLDHSSARGGAEYALLRMLQCSRLWKATLVVPPGEDRDWGVYKPLQTEESVVIKRRGPAQPSGASNDSVGPLSKVDLAIRLIGQWLAIRFSREFCSADIVHANTSRAGLYAALACMGSRKKLVIHLRDMVNDDGIGRVGRVLFSRIALARADGVIANSHATLDSARTHLRSACLSTVIESAAGLKGNNSPPYRNAAVQRVGMVARIDDWKGQDLLIRAFARVFGGSNVRLVLAGGAPFGHEEYAAELQKLAAAHGVAKQVDFVGHVEGVDALIQSFDICVQASLRSEPLGQNVLQYLYQGRASVAVDAGGPAEWIESGVNGLLFEMGNEHALADCLEMLAGDSDLRSRLAAAARTTRGLRSDADIARAHHDFFCRVARGTVDVRARAAAATRSPHGERRRVA